MHELLSKRRRGGDMYGIAKMLETKQSRLAAKVGAMAKGFDDVDVAWVDRGCTLHGKTR